MIKTYVINLKEVADRRENIRKEFKPFKDSFDIEFIEAVDGRRLSESQLREIFNQDLSFEIYGRFLNGGEIGCSLSHKKCIKQMINSGDRVAMIIEDDLKFQNVNVDEITRELEKYLRNDTPMMILLSGDYWYTTCKAKINDFSIQRVREACTSHAYMINRSAALTIEKLDDYLLADDFYLLKKCGFKLYGLKPHIADQDRRKFNSVITGGYVGTLRKNLKFKKRWHSYYRAVIKHILYYAKHFEFKSEIK